MRFPPVFHMAPSVLGGIQQEILLIYTLVKEKKEIYVIIRAKILHHPMIGDRTELSIVFASLFVKLS